ncbi:DUF1145 domain-containing protein [Phytopseudomonas punonensis]|uniref:Putative membrane protein n=1 Tax=Phytopseudomonas punonensis TaxID=1220495 RepID=A0A1M6X0B2_9GAMM|nr:DUF1145 domain-containing protein [Pseudomonas punonensis]SHK99408.1 putative membrane protein [Pseudomonas punonensis]
MKTIAGLGKLLATLFWCVVLANPITPYAQPFGQLLALAGVLLFGLHLVELALFSSVLRAQPRMGAERAKVLAFGMFHIWSLTRTEVVVQPVVTEEGVVCAS